MDRYSMAGPSSRANHPKEPHSVAVDPCLGFYTRSRASSIVPSSEPDEDGCIGELELLCHIYEESLESVTTPADEGMLDEPPQPSLPPIVTIEAFLKKYPPGSTQKHNLRKRRLIDNDKDFEPSDSISSPSSLDESRRARPESKSKHTRKPLADRLPTADNKMDTTEVHTPKRRRNVHLTDPRTTTPFRKASFTSGRLPHTDGRNSTKRPLTQWDPLDVLKLESPRKKLRLASPKRNGSPHRPPPLSFVPLEVAETSYASKGTRHINARAPACRSIPYKLPPRLPSADSHKQSQEDQVMDVAPPPEDEALRSLPEAREPEYPGGTLSQGPDDQLPLETETQPQVDQEQMCEEAPQSPQPLSSYFNKFFKNMKTAAATQAVTHESRFRRRPSTRSGRTQVGMSSSPTSGLQKLAGSPTGRCLYAQDSSAPSSQEEANDYMMPEPFLPSEFAEKALYAALSKRSTPEAPTQDSIPDVFASVQDDDFHVVMLSSFEHIPSQPLSPASTKAETLPPCTIDLFAGFNDYD